MYGEKLDMTKIKMTLLKDRKRGLGLEYDKKVVSRIATKKSQKSDPTNDAFVRTAYPVCGV